MKRALLTALLTLACGGDDSGDSGPGPGPDDVDGGTTVPTSSSCAPLDAPPAGAIELSPTDDLADALSSAADGDTFVLADGTY
ncbi:MAG: hypothetical protein KJO07_20205, partial [Deltaproteobacteria bacterium]|nr:hypothetical protein [Deltaproteobacteria bacterium]